MFEFFDTLAPENAERLSETRADKIKASVLSRIKEERPMKKHFRIKPFIIAAAIMTTGAVSVVSASAATNKNVSDLVAPSAVAEQPAAPITPEEPVLPDIQEAPVQEITPAPTETAEQPDTYFKKVSDEEAKELERKFIEEGESEIFEINGVKLKWINETVDDLELISVDSDGTKHYRSRFGGTVSHWSADGNDGDWGCGILVRVDVVD